MARTRMLARPVDSHDDWRRVGRHTRTGKFYWYGTDYATSLRHRGKLSGAMEKSDENVAAFQKWARKRGLAVKLETVKSSRRKEFVSLLKKEIGVTEKPLGSNRGPRVDWYRKATTLWPSAQYGWPWCAAFVVRMLLEAGYDLDNSLRTASVAKFTAEARKRGAIVSRDPKPGDIVVLINPGQHIGAMVADGQTVEGNTTPDGKHGSQYEGTAVARKNRSSKLIVHVIDPDKLAAQFSQLAGIILVMTEDELIHHRVKVLEDTQREMGVSMNALNIEVVKMRVAIETRSKSALFVFGIVHPIIVGVIVALIISSLRG